MGFIFRGLLIIFIFSLIVYLLKAVARLRFHLNGTMRDLRHIRDRIDLPQGGSREAVRCATCGTFLDRREALILRSRGSEQAFCSKECIAG